MKLRGREKGVTSSKEGSSRGLRRERKNHLEHKVRIIGPGGGNKKERKFVFLKVGRLRGGKSFELRGEI